jgi:hypothetical protein
MGSQPSAAGEGIEALPLEGGRRRRNGNGLGLNFRLVENLDGMSGHAV